MIQYRIVRYSLNHTKKYILEDWVALPKKGVYVSVDDYGDLNFNDRSAFEPDCIIELRLKS